jgi:hypothetical protein
MDDYDEYGGWKSGNGMSGHDKKWSGKKSHADNFKRCWEDHKPLKILNGVVLGAACGHPQKGYDIYIGLDYGMKYQNRNYPWEPGAGTVVEFLYSISDMCAPKSPKDFKAMIKWMAEQLEAGKKIQVGCIGGHGRTGLVLAALVAYTKVAPKNAIQYVRKHHCKKAVESASQIKFLMKHFKVSKAAPTKSSVSHSGSKHGKQFGNTSALVDRYSRAQNAVFTAVRSKGSIW